MLQNEYYRPAAPTGDHDTKIIKNLFEEHFGALNKI
jgi:hypothetical protein